MEQIIYTCSVCEKRQVRKVGGFYTADVPTCHNLVMQTSKVEVPQENVQLNQDLFELDVKMPEVKPAEVLRETTAHRTVRFGEYVDSCTVIEYIAGLGIGGITLHYMPSDAEPKTLRLDPAHMDTLCQAWQGFRRDCAEREAREQAKYQAERAALLAKCQELAKEFDASIEHVTDYGYCIKFPKGSIWGQPGRFIGGWDYLYLGDILERFHIMKKDKDAAEALQAEPSSQKEK